MQDFRRWVEENRTNQQREFKRLRQQANDHQIEEVGERLRGMMTHAKRGTTERGTRTGDPLAGGERGTGTVSNAERGGQHAE